MPGTWYQVCSYYVCLWLCLTLSLCLYGGFRHGDSWRRKKGKEKKSGYHTETEEELSWMWGFRSVGGGGGASGGVAALRRACRQTAVSPIFLGTNHPKIVWGHVSRNKGGKSEAGDQAAVSCSPPR